MDTLEWILVAGGVVVVAIVVMLIVTHNQQESDLYKTKKQFREFLKKNGVKHPRRVLKNMMKSHEQASALKQQLIGQGFAESYVATFVNGVKQN